MPYVKNVGDSENPILKFVDTCRQVVEFDIDVDGDLRVEFAGDGDIREAFSSFSREDSEVIAFIFGEHASTGGISPPDEERITKDGEFTFLCGGGARDVKGESHLGDTFGATIYPDGSLYVCVNGEGAAFSGPDCAKILEFLAGNPKAPVTHGLTDEELGQVARGAFAPNAVSVVPWSLVNEVTRGEYVSVARAIADAVIASINAGSPTPVAEPVVQDDIRDRMDHMEDVAHNVGVAVDEFVGKVDQLSEDFVTHRVAVHDVFRAMIQRMAGIEGQLRSAAQHLKSPTSMPSLNAAFSRLSGMTPEPEPEPAD